MEKNIGFSERVIRVVLGLAIFFLGINFKSWWGLAGFLPLLTGLIGWCGLYKIMGKNTCNVKK